MTAIRDHPAAPLSGYSQVELSGPTESSGIFIINTRVPMRLTGDGGDV